MKYDYKMSKAKEEIRKFTKSFIDNFISFLTSAFGMLVALSWNNVWTEWVKSLLVENTLYYKLFIAIFMTALAIVVTYILSKFKNSS